MNEADPVPPFINPNLNKSGLPLGSDPGERVPITGMVSAFEAILRQPRRVLFHLGQGKTQVVILALLGIFAVASLIYGLVIGTFSGHTQLWAAPVKVTLGLLVSAAICVPSLYIFACLSGAEARFWEVAGLVAGLLALMTILLIGFAPVAWVFSQSTDSIVAMGALHLIFWLIATYFGLRFLNAGFRQFSAAFNGGIKLWMIIFIVVVVQMSTALRPIIGSAPTFFPTEKKFFLAHWSDSFEKNGKRNDGGLYAPDHR